MRKRISHSIVKLGCYILSIPFLAAAPVYAVTLSPVDSIIGDEANWHISDKALIISGKGATYRYDAFDIYDAESDGRPWEEYRESIESVIVEEGITKIGNYLFANLPNLKSVSVADSVVSIGSYCFADCPNLKYTYIPAATTEIAADAFENVTGLTILGKTGSTAESYAQNHGCSFIAVP